MVEKAQVQTASHLDRDGFKRPNLSLTILCLTFSFTICWLFYALGKNEGCVLCSYKLYLHLTFVMVQGPMVLATVLYLSINSVTIDE